MIENLNVFLVDFGEEFVVESSGLSFNGIFSYKTELWENGDGASIESYIPVIMAMRGSSAETVLFGDTITRIKTGIEYSVPKSVYWSSIDQCLITIEEK